MIGSFQYVFCHSLQYHSLIISTAFLLEYLRNCIGSKPTSNRFAFRYTHLSCSKNRKAFKTLIKCISKIIIQQWNLSEMYALKTSCLTLRAINLFIIIFFLFYTCSFQNNLVSSASLCKPESWEKYDHSHGLFLFLQNYIGLNWFHYIFFRKCVSNLSRLRCARAFEKVRQE